MIQFQLWAFTPGSSDHTILPQPISWQASFVLSDVGSLSITYPIAAPGREILDGYSDVEVRYRLDGSDTWVCPPQGRFSVIDRDEDPVGQRNQPTRTYACQSYGWLLRRILQEKFTGLDVSGNRPFPSQSIGQVVGTLISEAKAAGSVPDLTYLNSAGTGGASPAVPVGKAALDILAEARDEGLVEWLIQPDGTGQGRKLVAYTSVGVDRSTGVTPVILHEGTDVVAAPSKVSIQDLAARAVASGDAGHYLTITNPGADLPYGLLADVVQAGGLTDAAALQIAAQARLDKGASPRAQHTRQIIFDKTTFYPFAHYGLGDTVLGPDESGDLAPLRVRQVTITMQQQSNMPLISGNLVLGDRFTERAERMDRKLRQLMGGAGAIAGNGRLPTPAADDKRAPSAPTGLVVGSTPYLDPQGNPKALASIGWVNPTTATDGSVFAPAQVEVWYRKGTGGAFARLTTVGFPATSVEWSPFDAGVTYQFQVRAVSSNSVAGPFSAVVGHAMALDTTPPPVASRPTLLSRLGMVQVTWDGRGSGNEVMPADFDHATVERATDAGFASPTVVGRLTGATLVMDGPLTVGSTYYYRLITVDKAGNAAAAGASRSVIVTGVTGPDYVANSVTANAIAVGSMTAMLVAGDVIRTSGSNPRIEFSSGQFLMTDAAGHSVALLQPSTGRIFLDSGSSSYPRLVLDSSAGLTWSRSSGNVTFRLDMATGDATFAGNITAGATITGAQIVGATYMSSTTTYPRVVISPDQGIRLYKTASTYAFFATAAGDAYFSGDIAASNISASTITGGQITGAVWQSSTTAYPRVVISADQGIRLYKTASTYAFFATMAGDAYFSGTVAASNINTTTINGAVWTGTQTNSGTVSGGSYSGMSASGSTWSGGSLSGTVSNSGVLSGGTYQTGSSGQRTSMSSSNGRLTLVDGSGVVAYVYNSAGNLYLLGNSAGGSLMQVSTDQMGLVSSGSAIATPAYSTTTASAANLYVSAGGILMRSTSSIRYKIDVQELPVDRRILGLQPKSWRPRRTSRAVSTARQVGFLAEDAHALGLRELVSYSRTGLPDALSYDRITAYLLPIVAEHDTTIADLTARIAALEGAAA